LSLFKGDFDVSLYLRDYDSNEKKGICRACSKPVQWYRERVASHKRANCWNITEEEKIFFGKKSTYGKTDDPWIEMPEPEPEFSLDEHVNKCRCCLESLDDEDEIFPITKTIEDRFFELTNIQLLDDDDLSKNICQFCNNQLRDISAFR
jgi:hypothetical protein